MPGSCALQTACAPEVKVISGAAFLSLMKQGYYWGSLAISDLDSINIDLRSSMAVPPAPTHLVATCKPIPLTTEECDLMEHMVPSQYHDYADVFSAAEADGLGPTITLLTWRKAQHLPLDLSI